MADTSPPTSLPFPITNTTLTVLITGANGGVGFGILQRLSNDFLRQAPATHTLHLIFTVRSLSKAQETHQRLLTYLSKRHDKNPKTRNWRSRIGIQGELVDLTSLTSILGLARKLKGSLEKIDVMVLNAGILGATGIDWLKLTWGLLTNFTHAIAHPDCHLQPVGLLTKPQLDSGESLGLVFCANVFGHYLLVHYLRGLLWRSEYVGRRGARVVFVGSLDSEQHFLDLADVQGIKSKSAYESSKAVLDIMASGSGWDVAQPYVEEFLRPTPQDEARLVEDKKTAPKIILTHPGICATSIATFLPSILAHLMLMTFYVARALGSKWHNADPYAGATSMVFACLAGDDEVRNDRKYGSAVERWKREFVETDEVEIVEGEEAVARVWREMEGLRKEWVGKLGDA